jgi:hypothetical protein
MGDDVSKIELRYVGPAEPWYCRCQDRHGPQLRGSFVDRCVMCGELAPHVQRVDRPLEQEAA